MTQMTITYQGELHCHAEHPASGESFSPTDLVATALAACILTMMAKKAENLGIAYREPHITAEKHMKTEPRRIGEIVLNIHFQDAYDDKTRRIIEATAHACPVAQSLHPDLKQTLHFHYPL